MEMIESIFSNRIFITIAVSVVLCLSGLVSAFLVRVNIRVRYLIRNARNDDSINSATWERARAISYVLIALSVVNIPAIVFLTQFIVQIVVVVILQFVYVYGLELIIAKAMDTVNQKIDENGQSANSSSTSQVKNIQFLPKLLPPLFNKHEVSEISVGSSVSLAPTIMFIDLFSCVPAEYSNNKQKFYTVFSELVELAGSVGLQYNLSYTRCTSRGIVMLFDTGGADAIETFLKVKLEILKRPHLLPPVSGKVGDTFVNGTVYSGDVNVVMVNDGNFHQAVLSSEAAETVISFAGIARELRIPLLISETVKKDINTSKFQTRYMGLIRSHDSRWLIPTYDVINANSTQHIPALIENSDAFVTARKLQEAGKVQKAFSMFSQIIFQDPHDYAAGYFRDQCRQALAAKSRERRETDHSEQTDNVVNM